MDDFEDAFDTAAFEPDEHGNDPTTLIPPKLLELCQKHRDATSHVRCKYRDASGKWALLPGRYTMDPDEPADPEKMALKILEIATRHHRKPHTPGSTSYRGVCMVSAKGGGLVERQAAFSATLSMDGSLGWEDDEEWKEEKSENALLRELVTDMRAERESLAAMHLKDRQDMTSQVVDLTGAIRDMVHEIQGLAQGMGSLVSASTEASKGILAMWQDRDRGNVEIRKLDYEYKLQQAQLDADQTDRADARQTRAQALEQLKVFAPFILKQAFKLDDDTFRLVMAVMQGGGGGGAPLALQASPDEQKAGKPWEPPAKPPAPEDDRDENDWGAREQLAVWFHQLTDEQERGTRRIVGPELYDLIRDSASQSDDQVQHALTRFMSEVNKLDTEHKSALITNLLNVLGTWGPTFLGIAGKATGQSFQ